MPQIHPFVHAGVLLSLLPAIASAQSWEISVGPAARFAQNIDITGTSLTQVSGVRAASTYETDPASVGNPSETADRTYANGFVRLDPGTNNPEAIGGPGLTWNWGYANASQWNAAANLLTFTQGGGDRLVRSTVLDTVLDASEKQESFGLRIGALRLLDSGRGTKVALQVGLTALSGDAGSSSYATYAESYTRTSYTVTDRYDTSAIVVPPAPYSGTFDGPGPVIGNRPVSRERSAGTVTSTFTAANTVSFDIDTRSVELAVGPRLTFAAADWLDLFIVPSAVAGYQKLDVERKERFVTSTGTTVLDRRERKTAHDLSLGFSIDIGAALAVTDGWMVSVQGGYMAVTDEVVVRMGPNEVSFSPSGFQASLSAVFAF